MGPIGDDGRGTQEVAPGGNLEKKNGITLVGKGGTANPVVVFGGRTYGRTYLNDNGPHPKGEGGVPGYQSSGSGMEGMRGGPEINAEEGVGDP